MHFPSSPHVVFPRLKYKRGDREMIRQKENHLCINLHVHVCTRATHMYMYILAFAPDLVHTMYVHVFK